jgi:hypothetical protein
MLLQQETEIENLKIIPPSKKDGTSPALYVARVWRIVSNKNLSRQKKRSLITDTNRQNPNRANFGEQAAFEVIKSLDPSVPVFFWSNDKRALDQAEALDAHMVTTANFVAALGKRGIWRAIGIKASTAQLLDLMVEYSKQVGLCSAGLIGDPHYSSEGRRMVFKQTLQPVKPVETRRQTVLDGVRGKVESVFVQPGF